MKLLCCTKCSSIFNLSREWKECNCEVVRVGGQYIDNLNAEVSGPKENLVVLGFANSSFISALRHQREEGDLDGFFGRRFEAFIIPEKAESIERNLS